METLKLVDVVPEVGWLDVLESFPPCSAWTLDSTVCFICCSVSSGLKDGVGQ